MASLFTLIRVTGVECDNNWRNASEVISSEVDTLPLPRFESLVIDYSYDADDGEDYSIYVKYGLHVVLRVDSTATEPYAFIPETFSENIDLSLESGELRLEIGFPERYYVYDDSVSSAITVNIPVSMNLSQVICPNYVTSHLIIESFNNIGNINCRLNSNVYLYFNYCIFDSVTICDNAYVNVYDSEINTLTMTGTGYSDVIYNNGSHVKETRLKGCDVEYNLSGVDGYHAYPDSSSIISVKQVFEN